MFSCLDLIGCSLYISYRFDHQGDYETWIHITFAIQGFDRLLAWPIKLIRNSSKKTYVLLIDKDYIKVDVPGLKGDSHMYLDFSTLT